MKKPTEKQLDKAFAAKVEKSSDFREWLLSQTKFKGRPASLIEANARNPWYQSQTSGIQSETDILLIFLGDDSTTFALHIENKLASGKFTKGQPEFYRKRADEWMNTLKYYFYTEYQIVVIAPRSFYNSYTAECKKFDVYVPHEEIARFIPEFAP